jgi:hypothetical protein
MSGARHLHSSARDGILIRMSDWGVDVGDRVLRVISKQVLHALIEVIHRMFVAEPSKITHFRRNLSSTRHYIPRKWARSNSLVERTQRENLKQSTFYIQNPITSTSLQYLVYFIQHGVLEIIYYNTRVHSTIIKQRN